MQLLVVTSAWPLSENTEFLDGEIRYLSEQFSKVVVVPMRPRGPLADELPNGVSVDTSLAEQLVRSRLSQSSRVLTAAARAVQPNSAGFGFSRRDLVNDWRQLGWIRSALLGRADSKSVAQWASSRQPPALAYTFWLGPATVGLHQAWPTVPLVSRVHGGDLFSEAHGWTSIPYQRAALRSANRIASVSENGRTYLAGKFPETNEKLVWRRLGIRDLGGVTAPSGSTVIRILSASSIDSNKRVPLIAEVARWIVRSHHAVEWTHLGDGPGRKAVERALAGRPDGLVVKLRGHVPLNEVHRELTSGYHGVFINLSLSEGAPVSLIEAQCVGLPVVATAVGGTPEVVPSDWNELVRPAASVPEIAGAVLRAHQRPDYERQERRRLWAHTYSEQTNYSVWASELHHLASEGR